MCEWGDTIPVKVKIAADLSNTGQEKWRQYGIDRCIVPIVKALQEAGIDMRASCCGHGKIYGNIALADGRMLDIFPDFNSWYVHAQEHGHCKGGGK